MSCRPDHPRPAGKFPLGAMTDYTWLDILIGVAAAVLRSPRSRRPAVGLSGHPDRSRPRLHPGLGYADDAIVVVLVLRSVCRRVPLDDLRKAWPGTDDGFAALSRLVGRPGPSAGKPTGI